jgi:hypothetical protein
MAQRGPGVTATLEQAAFVVSVDTELAWGIHDQGRDAVEAGGPNRAADERAVVGSVLDLLARHDVPATWAVVGHLFLGSCRRRDGRIHPGVLRPSYDWHDGDWFALDPGSDLGSDPWWYGSDIIDWIRRADPPHEIGSHSFSHLVAGDPGCGEEVFESDLAACLDVAAAADLELRSYVFSKNSIGHLGVLERHGFVAYRGHRPRPFADAGRVRGRVMRALDGLSPQAGSAVYPERVGGLWNIPATNFYGPAARTDRMPFPLWVTRQVQRLELAGRTRSLYHLWFHPQDLLGDVDRALSGLDRILERAAALRRAGTMRTITMSRLAASLDDSLPPRDP